MLKNVEFNVYLSNHNLMSVIILKRLSDITSDARLFMIIEFKLKNRRN